MVDGNLMSSCSLPHMTKSDLIRFYATPNFTVMIAFPVSICLALVATWQSSFTKSMRKTCEKCYIYLSLISLMTFILLSLSWSFPLWLRPYYLLVELCRSNPFPSYSVQVSSHKSSSVSVSSEHFGKTLLPSCFP